MYAVQALCGTHNSQAVQQYHPRILHSGKCVRPAFETPVGRAVSQVLPEVRDCT